MEPLADKFAERFRGRRSDNTVIQYRQAARNFDKYLEAHGRTVHNLHPGDMDDYVKWLIDCDYKPNSIHNYVTIVTMYCDWCRQAGLEVPKMAKPLLPRVQKKRMDILPDKLIPLYNDACISYVKQPFLTALMLLPMTGLRVTEMCSIEMKKVDIGPATDESPAGTAQIHVVGKGNKYRPVPVLMEGIPVLADYLLNERHKFRNSKWLFPASKSKGAHIDRHQISGRLKLVKQKLGIPKLHPHLLRHTYGTILNEAGIDGFDLASIMGHSDIRVTSVYVHPVESRLLSDVSQLSYQTKRKIK